MWRHNKYSQSEGVPMFVTFFKMFQTQTNLKLTRMKMRALSMIFLYTSSVLLDLL